MTALDSILYVENQPFFDDEELLRLESINYDVADTAVAARDKLQTKTYSAVLLDIMLEPGEYDLIPQDVPPYMGGVSVLRLISEDRFKAAGNGKDLPVLVYTAVGLQEVKEVVLSLLGVHAKDRYFEKPESFEKVLKVLKTVISQRRTGP
jgi:DNA-binding response OmpR family regulator